MSQCVWWVCLSSFFLLVSLGSAAKTIRTNETRMIQSKRDLFLSFSCETSCWFWFALQSFLCIKEKNSNMNLNDIKSEENFLFFEKIVQLQRKEDSITRATLPNQLKSQETRQQLFREWKNKQTNNCSSGIDVSWKKKKIYKMVISMWVGGKCRFSSFRHLFDLWTRPGTEFHQSILLDCAHFWQRIIINFWICNPISNEI